MLLKELMLTRPANQNSVRFVTIVKNWFKFEPFLCNRCQGLLIMSVNLSDIFVLHIKSTDYHCIISGISKTETINLTQNIDLTEESGTL